mmetsp:Transcript_38696/g.71933  ORF Transcript_38696/g.71933 Transcript_38696/m.71933 type:complete len:250 (-) Transcript_38696:329-1078(-)
MLAIQVSTRCQRNEKLRAVGVLPCVGHREKTGGLVRDVAVRPLVLKLLPIDRLATCSIATGEISPLAHKARDDPVEGTAFEGQRLPRLAGALLSCAESAEVLRGLGVALGKQLNLYARWLRFANLDLQEDLGVLLRRRLGDGQLLEVRRRPLLEVALEHLEGHEAKQRNRHGVRLGLFHQPRQAFGWRTNLEELQLEGDCCVRRDSTARTTRAVCNRARQPNSPGVARLHHEQRLLKPWYQVCGLEARR